MTYLQTNRNDYKTQKISLNEFKRLEETYESSNEKEIIQRQYKKDLEIKNYHNEVRRIRKFIQYFFWFSIITIITTLTSLLLY